ncbi:hypothetical protein L9F63_007854, partial [Diploptera punctata]
TLFKFSSILHAYMWYKKLRYVCCVMVLFQINNVLKNITPELCTRYIFVYVPILSDLVAASVAEYLVSSISLQEENRLGDVMEELIFMSPL